LYLRRQALIDAMEKLKTGETIGPVTKAFKEKEEQEQKEKGEKKKEVGEKKEEGEEKKEEQEEKKQEAKEEETEKKADGETQQTLSELKETETQDPVEKQEKSEDMADKEEDGATALGSPASIASEATIRPSTDKEESPDAKPLHKSIDSDATSEATSMEPDIPPTPPSVELVVSPDEPEADPDELIQANIHESLVLRNPVPSKMTSSLTATDKLLPITPPLEADKTAISELEKALTDTAVPLAEGVPAPPFAEGLAPTMLVNGVTVDVEQPETRTEVVIPEESAKTMLDWEMLRMCINWIKKEFSTDEEALARQLSNNEISYRFLWLYFIPGTMVSLQDPISKQQMAARVDNPLPS
jgi:flagellar biosynthesis GTPase FlhF